MCAACPALPRSLVLGLTQRPVPSWFWNVPPGPNWLVAACSTAPPRSMVVRLMQRHPSVVPFLVHISNEAKHMERFAVRSKVMTLRPDGEPRC